MFNLIFVVLSLIFLSCAVNAQNDYGESNLTEITPQQNQYVVGSAHQMGESGPVGKIFILVSGSMPHGSLSQWYIDAKKLGIPLTFRGWINGSPQNTKVFVSDLLEKTGAKDTKGGIEINPVAFEAYGVDRVPAVIVTHGPYHCAHGHCTTHPFVVVYGDTGLESALATALKTVASMPELAQDEILISSLESAKNVLGGDHDE